jgi:Tol biopolymer transport system component
MFLSFSLTLLPVLATRGAYPGINGKVVFWAVAANLINNRIFVMNLDGTDLKQLPPPPLEPSVLPDEDPVWSPDGSKIAFYNDWPAIYVMNADGSNQIPLLKGGPDFADPAWSRDGSKIAFAISGDGIYVINTDGSGKRQVTDYFDLSPHWSPDGTKIVLQRVLDGTDSIVVVDATTGDYVGKHPLATGEGPCWSPDGSKIVFSSGGDIYVMNADGSGLAGPLIDGEEPNWSPDGSKMLFVRIENGLGRIWVMNHDGSNPTSLTPPDLDAHHPDWQRLSPAAVGGEVVIADAFSILLPCIAVIGLIGCITIVVLVPKKRRL